MITVHLGLVGVAVLGRQMGLFATQVNRILRARVVVSGTRDEPPGDRPRMGPTRS